VPKTTADGASTDEVWRPTGAPGLEVAVKTAPRQLVFEPAALLSQFGDLLPPAAANPSLLGAARRVVESRRPTTALARDAGL